MYHSFKDEILQNRYWLLLGGLILSLCGAALLLNFYLPYAKIDLFLACVYFVASDMIIIQAFRFWYKKAIGFWLHILSFILYCSIGILFILNFYFFVYDLFYLVLLILALSLIVMGVFRLMVAISQKLRNGWLWTAYCGFLNLLSVPFIFFAYHKFPFSALTITTGIDLLATGIALVALGIAGIYSIKK